MQDFQSQFIGQKVLILGLARQGLASARFFVEAGAHVTISDIATAEKLETELAALGDLPVSLALGGHPLSLLDACDLLCLSGGVPPQIEIVRTAIQRNIPLTNDSLLTVQLAKANQLGPVVAITGSSGKTTTTTLVGEMLRASGLTVYVGGNIGTPLVDRLDTVQPGDVLVLELSSFQLELFNPAISLWVEEQETPASLGIDVAAILNLTPNHLDRHGTMAVYVSTKLNLLRHLSTTAQIVLNDSFDFQTEDAQSGTDRVLLAERNAQIRYFQTRDFRCNATGVYADNIFASVRQNELVYQDKSFCSVDEVLLPGAHNIDNLLAAATISGAAGATHDAMGQVARTFAGVPHRLEIVSQHNEVTWINDSIATAPERAVAALRSFGDETNLILLAGGKDKHLPWQVFADEVIDRVQFLIGFGDAGAMIIRTVQEQALQRRSSAPGCAVVGRLDEAVDLAARVAEAKSVVLMSPGGTSFDAYKDFEERGEHFRALVKERWGDGVMG